MKIRVHFKTPDAVESAWISQFGQNDKEGLAECEEQLTKWIQYGECLTVEFDTEAGTATVLPVE